MDAEDADAVVAELPSIRSRFDGAASVSLRLDFDRPLSIRGALQVALEPIANGRVEL